MVYEKLIKFWVRNFLIAVQQCKNYDRWTRAGNQKALNAEWRELFFSDNQRP